MIKVPKNAGPAHLDLRALIRLPQGCRPIDQPKPSVDTEHYLANVGWLHQDVVETLRRHVRHEQRRVYS